LFSWQGALPQDQEKILDQEVNKDSGVKPDPPASKEHRASVESGVRKAGPAEQEPMACKVCPVCQEFTAPRAPVEPWGLLAETEETESRVRRRLFPRASGSRVDRRATRCKTERTAREVNVVLWALRDRKVPSVRRVNRDSMARMERQDSMVVMDFRVLLEPRAHKAWQEPGALTEPWDQQALRDHKASPV